MKSLLLLGATFMLSHSFSQTILMSESFETGGTNFTLNTSDLGGQVGLAGDNAWVINNVYTGGSGTSSCFGFGFTIPASPSQPAGIANGPNSNYLHILSDDGSNNGLLNANYSAADGSFCFFAQSHFVKMNNDVSTVGMNNVELDFWWMCMGDPNAFGEVYYSTNGGVNWTLITAPISNYSGSSTWQNQVLTNAAWNNQPTLRFAYRFVNNVATGGGDPSFSIDDVKIRATTVSANSITTTNDVSPASWCYNTLANGTVNFTSTGTFTAGNVYTAQLSDAAGSFAAPTSIGTLSSTASGSLSIATSISAGVAAGTGYRIRVVSSSPSTIGTDNAANLVVNALPTVTMGALADVCTYNSAFSLTQGTPASGTYSGTGVSGGMFTPSSAGLGAHTITYTYVDGNGCSNSANTTINVNACASIEEIKSAQILIVPNPTETSFEISGIDVDSKVELVDFSGKVISVIQSGDNSYDVSGLAQGVYVVRIIKNTEVILTKLIKK